MSLLGRLNAAYCVGTVRSKTNENDLFKVEIAAVVCGRYIELEMGSLDLARPFVSMLKSPLGFGQTPVETRVE